MLELQQYTFDVKYRRGKLNRVPSHDFQRYMPSVIRAAPGTMGSYAGSANDPTSSPTTPCSAENYTGTSYIRPTSARYSPTFNGKNAYRNTNAPRSYTACTTNPLQAT